jgi:hypothetical protein
MQLAGNVVKIYKQDMMHSSKYHSNFQNLFAIETQGNLSRNSGNTK